MTPDSHATSSQALSYGQEQPVRKGQVPDHVHCSQPQILGFESGVISMLAD